MLSTLSEITVVIVDDHPVFREGLRNILEQAGIKVIAEAGTVASGIDAIRSFKPSVAIIDIDLSDGNGHEILRAITGERIPTHTVVLTGYDDISQREISFSEGARAYCAKDSPPNDIISAVHAAAKGLYWENGKISQYRRAKTPYQHQGHSLSPREMEVLKMLTRGMSNKEIAHTLGISEQTVKNHVASIFRKLDVRDRTQAVVYALKHGLVQLYPRNYRG